MKIKTTIISLLLVAVMAVPTQIVVAQTNVEESTTTSETEGSTGSEDSADTTPERRGNRPTDLDERKAERRAELMERLSENKLKGVEARCDAAQRRVEKIVSQVRTVAENRTRVYDVVLNRIDAIIERLDAIEIDTAELTNEADELAVLVEEFFTFITDYEIAVADAAEFDCTEDAEAFALALEDARSYRDAAKDKAKEIGEYVRGTIFDTLLDIKLDLAKKEDSSSEGESTEPSESETESPETENPESESGEGTESETPVENPEDTTETEV